MLAGMLKVHPSPLGRITPKLQNRHRARPRPYRPFVQSSDATPLADRSGAFPESRRPSTEA